MATAVVLDAARKRGLELRGSALFTMQCSMLQLVVAARIDSFITEDGKGPYPDME